MSTGKAQISNSTTGSVEVLREAQEATIKAARKLQRKHAQSKFRSVITEMESIDERRRDAIHASDNASKTFPDYVSPKIPETLHIRTPAIDATTDEISSLTKQFRSEVSKYNENISAYNSAVQQAVNLAEEKLRRRNKMANAFSKIQGVKQNCIYLVNAIESLSESSSTLAPDDPIDSTNPDDLENIEDSLSDWKSYFNELTQHLNSAKCRDEVVKRLSATSGKLISTESASDLWRDFLKEQETSQRKVLNTAKENALSASSVSIPKDRINLIDDIIESTPFAIDASQISRMIGRISTEIHCQRKASEMLLDIPNFIETTPDWLLSEWNAHQSNIQKVSQGQASWSNSLERTHEAIHKSHRHHVKVEEMKAHLIGQHGDMFSFYNADTQLIAEHNNTDYGYLINIEVNEERGNVASGWELVYLGDDEPNRKGYKSVCGDYKKGTQSSAMQSFEIEQGNVGSVRKHSKPKSMQQVIY